MSRRPIPPARALAMLAVLALLAGCSTLSPYSRRTKLDLALSAGERVNPDLNGRPSPVVVRLFELNTRWRSRTPTSSASTNVPRRPWTPTW